MNEIVTSNSEAASIGTTAPIESGHIRFHGIYWKKEDVEWQARRLLGQPQGWFGSGTFKQDEEYKKQMNFWNQKGIYILYNNNFDVIYSGQAGFSQKSKIGFGSIGERMLSHKNDYFNHAWVYFSWFGFLDTKKIALREASQESRMNPDFKFENSNSSLNNLLNSFEAITVEGFQPRYNSRGGNLKGATLVKQSSIKEPS